MEWSVTPLSALFLALIGLGVFPNLFYAWGYRGHLLRRGHFTVHYLLFIAAMAGVVTAQTPMSFLLSWELMSLTSWQLILTDPRGDKTRKAARFYFFMTHFGFMALTLFFLVASQGQLTLGFDKIDPHSWSEPVRWLLFTLLALGTLSKAGVVPLHVWLPYAHPAAPSPVSALMSGVMLKVALFALMQFLLIWLQPWPLAWGVILLTLGSISALVGVLYALAEHDLKALLANHSIENIGIILIALAMGLIFSTLNLPALAAFAWLAALFHTFNHMSFKALLFMGAGTVLAKTHTGHIEHYGGLIKTMPVTALSFLFAAVSISALPPTNGFISEWMVFQSLLGSTHFDALSLKLGIPFAIFALALTGGLAVACFAKAFGITFLGLHRSQNAAHAHEGNGWIQFALVLMSAVVASLMLAAPAYLAGFNGVLIHYGLMDIRSQMLPGDELIQSVADNGGRVAPLYLLALLVGLTALLYALGRWLNPKVRHFHTWACGGHTTARNQYTATGFAGPIRVFFSWLYRPQETVHKTQHAQHAHSKFHQAAYHLHVTPLFETSLYQGTVQLFYRLGYWMSRFAYLQRNRYTLMILLALLLIFALHRWGGFGG